MVAEEQEFADFMKEGFVSSNIQMSFGRTSVSQSSYIKVYILSSIVLCMKCCPLFLV